MATHTLLVEESIGMRILGLIHKDRIHRAVWKINSQLSFPLERGKDIEIQQKDAHSFFPCYYATLSESDTDYYLVRNRGTMGFFIQEYKQFDLVLIERNYDCTYDPTLIDQLNKAGINHVLEIEYESLKQQTRSNLEI